jgi:ABC-type phosphate transport system substrate-binding protein
MKKLILTVMALSLWLCAPAFSETIVIVNNGVAATALDADTLQKIYLGKTTQWDNGDKISAVTLNEGPVHDGFLNNIIKKSSSQFLTYWKQMIFTGKGTPPKSVPSETEVVGFVSSTPGGIGYIDSATPHDGVKAIPVN